MLAIKKAEGMDPKNYTDRVYTIEAYQRVYGEPLYTLSIASLTLDADTTTPASEGKRAIQELRGSGPSRETKKRRCGKCKKLCRHTRRTCPNAVATAGSADGDSGARRS